MSPRRAPLAFAAFAAFVALPAGLSLGACEDRPVHAFVAARFDPEAACLEEPGAVDVVAGADPGPCAVARCWVTPSGEVFVSTTACDAPPDVIDRTGDPAGSPCAEALDALSSGADCTP